MEGRGGLDTYLWSSDEKPNRVSSFNEERQNTEYIICLNSGVRGVKLALARISWTACSNGFNLHVWGCWGCCSFCVLIIAVEGRKTESCLPDWTWCFQRVAQHSDVFQVHCGDWKKQKKQRSGGQIKRNLYFLRWRCLLPLQCSSVCMCACAACGGPRLIPKLNLPQRDATLQTQLTHSVIPCVYKHSGFLFTLIVTSSTWV